APGVLEGAGDPDGDRLTAVLISPPAGGTLNLNPDGSFTYTPQAGFVGVDVFRIAAFDGEAQSAPVEVRITVTGDVTSTPENLVFLPLIVR
ncbi:MAG: Ig-like domain-containing protein, partial [Roseiflexus sp.]